MLTVLEVQLCLMFAVVMCQRPQIPLMSLIFVSPLYLRFPKFTSGRMACSSFSCNPPCYTKVLLEWW